MSTENPSQPSKPQLTARFPYVASAQFQYSDSTPLRAQHCSYRRCSWLDMLGSVVSATEIKSLVKYRIGMSPLHPHLKLLTLLPTAEVKIKVKNHPFLNTIAGHYGKAGYYGKAGPASALVVTGRETTPPPPQTQTQTRVLYYSSVIFHKRSAIQGNPSLRTR